MNNPVPVARKVSPFLLGIIVITLLLSLFSIYQGLAEYLSPTGDPNTGSIYLSMGLVILAFSTYWLFQIRKRMLRLIGMEVQPLSTTLQCQKCGFKNVREFQRGDFVFKQTDQACPKDNEKMTISAIYRELKEKEKAKEEGYH